MDQLIDRVAKPLPATVQPAYRFAWGDGGRCVTLRGQFGQVHPNGLFWKHLFAAILRRPISLDVEITLDEKHAAAIAARYAVERAKRNDPDVADFFGMSSGELSEALKDPCFSTEGMILPVRNGLAVEAMEVRGEL